ncbi:HAMP domain-containing sensor histidine kinase [Nocardioides sp. GY 10127]|uniref:sensor histidine kinase n=1 Tax=Nocardioides sp. GY 10127 TaxID=2569762 RepID=UPI0010A92A87|nr:HAMP domain-containing sensor histidine kinase [Nocardioides sp. GY 10127]TIC81845.1 HAMP domain-containing histidine kinase [Nocardioides sp. GY 10127]
MTRLTLGQALPGPVLPVPPPALDLTLGLAAVAAVLSRTTRTRVLSLALLLGALWLRVPQALADPDHAGLAPALTIALGALLAAGETCWRRRCLRATRADASAAEAATWHELRSISAGLAGVAELLRDPGLPAAEQPRLTALLVSEAQRLQRRTRFPDSSGRALDEPPGCQAEVDVVLDTLVTSHRARGMDVSWQPVGTRAAVSTDALSEMVGVLLDNAARHAPGARVGVLTARDAATLRITVANDGPPVPRTLAPRLFSPGVRGRATGGSGIGLAAARLLARSGGGDLRLAGNGRAGVRWELTLPEASAVTSPSSSEVDVDA